MPIRLYDSAGAEPDRESEPGPNIVSGIVVNNCDLFPQGMVLVRIPSLDQEVWARLTSIGGGSERGFPLHPAHRRRGRRRHQQRRARQRLRARRPLEHAGLAAPLRRPPANAQTKRVIRTGLTPEVGHEIEFDDALQSIKIVSSTEQRITIDPTTIELTNAAGTLTITLDNESQTIPIEGVNVSVEAAAKLTLKGRRVEIKSEPLPLSITSTSACSIKGTPIKLN